MRRLFVNAIRDCANVCVHARALEQRDYFLLESHPIIFHQMPIRRSNAQVSHVQLKSLHSVPRQRCLGTKCYLNKRLTQSGFAI